VSGAGRPGRGTPRRLALGFVALAAVAVLLTPGGAAGGPMSSSSSHPASAPRPALTVFNSIGGWVTLGGSEARSGYTPLAGPLSALAGNSFCPTPFPIQAGPVAAGTLAYVADTLGNIYAINRTHLDNGGGNGSIVWTASVGGAPTTRT
jgi:hypothetical protein